MSSCSIVIGISRVANIVSNFRITHRPYILSTLSLSPSVPSFLPFILCWIIIWCTAIYCIACYSMIRKLRATWRWTLCSVLKTHFDPMWRKRWVRHMHTQIHKYTYFCISIHVYACVYIRIHRYINIHTSVYLYMYMHVYIHALWSSSLLILEMAINSRRKVMFMMYRVDKR